MLKGEHSAILSTFIRLPFIIKIFILSIFEWPFYKGFTIRLSVLSQVIIQLCVKVKIGERISKTAAYLLLKHHVLVLTLLPLWQYNRCFKNNSGNSTKLCHQ